MDEYDPYPQQPPVRPGPPSRPPPERGGGSPLRLLVLASILGALGAVMAMRWFDRGTPAVAPRPVVARGEIAGDEQATIDVFRQASPSVVFITTVAEVRDLWTRDITAIPRGTGSGFIWDDAGHIVTNYHVIDAVARGRTSVRVTLADHSTFPAELVGIAPDQDLAVLRIDAPREKLIPIPVGTSGDLVVGQKAFAVGNPFGLDQSLTTGVVSALGRSIESMTGRPIEDVIQTDAAINPGNSGGPLLDSAARLIGVNTAIYSPSGAYAGIGFAVPVDTVNRVVPQLIAEGRFAPPSLGIRFDERLSRRVLSRLGVEGVLVVDVRPGSPADRAGLRGVRLEPRGIRIGDIIVGIGDQRVRSEDDVYTALLRHDPGDTVTVSVLRGSQVVEVPVQLDAPGAP